MFHLRTILFVCMVFFYEYLVPIPTTTSNTRKQSSQQYNHQISASTSSKPFVASSVTPAPTLPPPLVLPSEIRRGSLVGSVKSRSTSPAPPILSKSYSALDSNTTGSVVPKKRNASTLNQASSSSSLSSMAMPGSRRSSTPGIDSVKLGPTVTYNPYTGSKSMVPATKSATFTSSTVPPSIRRASARSFSNIEDISPSKPQGRTASGRAQSMTMSSQTAKNLMSQAPVKTQPVKAVPEKKPSFSNRLKKAFSFGSRKDIPTSAPVAAPVKTAASRSSAAVPASGDRSFSFVKKKRAATMTGAIVPPNLTTKDNGRFQTISMSASYSDGISKRLKTGEMDTAKSKEKSGHSHTFSFSKRSMFGGSSSRRTSTMSSSVAPPNFEGFTSSNVEMKQNGQISRRGHSKSMIDDDSVSVHSTASSASFATLRKMGRSLFSKSSSSNLQHQSSGKLANDSARQGSREIQSPDVTDYELTKTSPIASSPLEFTAFSINSTANSPTSSSQPSNSNSTSNSSSTLYVNKPRSRTSSIATTSMSHAVAEADRPSAFRSSASSVLSAAIHQRTHSLNQNSINNDSLDQAVTSLSQSLNSFHLDSVADEAQSDTSSFVGKDDEAIIVKAPTTNATSPSTETSAPAFNTDLFNSAQQNGDNINRDDAQSPGTGIVSSTGSSEGEDSSEEDLNAADTVFPKNLDNITVETIRSSLERAKSLERHRSRRSTRSNKSSHAHNNSVNRTIGHAPAGVHIPQDQVSINEPSHDAVASKSILKPTAEQPQPSAPNRARASSRSSSIPPVPQVPSLDLSSSDLSLPSTPRDSEHRDSRPSSPRVAHNTNLATSPSMNAIFNFGDDDLNLDFEFSSTPALSLTPQLGNFDTSNEAPAFSSLSRPESTKSFEITEPTTGQAPLTEVSVQPVEQSVTEKVESPRRSSFHRRTGTSSSVASTPSPIHSPIPGSPSLSSRLNSRQNSNNSIASLHDSARYQQVASPHYPQYTRSVSNTSMNGNPSGSQPSLRGYHQPLHHKPHNVSFSSRIIIYDTYDGSDYDRRAEIATCNRLTPFLAQQIKEELNNFKMEMDVHEESRIYTHFF